MRDELKKSYYKSLHIVTFDMRKDALFSWKKVGIESRRGRRHQDGNRNLEYAFLIRLTYYYRCVYHVID
jgi:hypothetical protein